MRITDLKNFFDLDQFWSARTEFIDIAGRFGLDFFFDSEDEILLYECLVPWLKEGKIPKANVKDGRLIISSNGDDHSFSLVKRLREKCDIATRNKNLLEKDIFGLTILYVLIGANAENSSMELKYDDFANIKDRLHTGRPIGIDQDLILEHAVVNEGDQVEWRVIFNKGEKRIKVELGKTSCELDHRDCVIGIFPRNDENKCWKLLPNIIVSDPAYKLSLRLRFNSNTMRPKMKVERKGNVEYVEDVYFILIENNKQVVYIKSNGEIHGIDSCFSLGRAYGAYESKMKKQKKQYKLLAIETTCKRYKFITDHGIIDPW